MNECHLAKKKLLLAKERRTAARDRERALAEITRVDAEYQKAAQAEVDKLEQMLRGFIAAGVAAHNDHNHLDTVAQAMACKGGLERTKILLEIGHGKAVASQSKHAQVAAEVREIELDVASAARALLDAEMIESAREYNSDFDKLTIKGAHLQALAQRNPFDTPLHMLGHALPAEVERALERMPKADLLHVPLNLLRASSGASDAWTKRLAALAADEPSDNVAT